MTCDNSLVKGNPSRSTWPGQPEADGFSHRTPDLASADLAGNARRMPFLLPQTSRERAHSRRSALPSPTHNGDGRRPSPDLPRHSSLRPNVAPGRWVADRQGRQRPRGTADGDSRSLLTSDWSIWARSTPVPVTRETAHRSNAVRIDDVGGDSIGHRDGPLLEDRLGDDVGGVASDRRGDVRVQIQCDADGGVAEPLAYDLRMHARLQRQRGVSVA